MNIRDMQIGGSCDSCGAVVGNPHKPFCLAYPPNKIGGVKVSNKKITIRVYLTNGNVYKYFVDTPEQARDHANEIVMFGYRSCNNDKKELTHFPPHRILKVKCVGEGIKTEYPDTIEGT